MVSVFPANGVIRAILAEVTDSVQLEQVRRSERLLAEAERLANVGSWEVDDITGDSRWSPNLCALLGLDSSRTKFTEDDFWELVHPDDREAVRGIIERAMERW
jgi:PAS domain-containing protein